MVENNQFRKHVFEDGSVIVAPKAFIMSDFSVKNIKAV